MAEIAPLPFDIIEPAMPPAPPPDITWMLVAGTVTALVLIVLAVIHWRRTRHQRLARKQLARARQAFRTGALNAHDAAFAIAEALRTAFAVQQLTASESGDARWRAYLAKLDAARYRAATSEVGELFAEAARWLRGKAPC